MSDQQSIDPPPLLPCDDNAVVTGLAALSQKDAKRIAAGIAAAYTAYANGTEPVLEGYSNITSIYVWEITSPLPADTSTRSVVPVADARPSRAGVTPGATSSGDDLQLPFKVLFGFAATSDDTDDPHNLVVFRGTATADETYYDISGWGSNVGCYFPTQDWIPWDKTCYGQVNSSLYDFYTSDGPTPDTSLADYCQSAIAAVAGLNSNARWLLGAHSLGGAMISLAALDGVAGKAFGEGVAPTVVTFGSLHVGLADFKQNYATNVPSSYRVANLCDFVPSMVSLEPVTPVPPYCHVGSPGTFVWQKWDDWANHSMTDTYQVMVDTADYWPLIQWTKRSYPQ